jgi:hypothetical protein
LKAFLEFGDFRDLKYLKFLSFGKILRLLSMGRLRFGFEAYGVGSEALGSFLFGFEASVGIGGCC